MCPLYTVGFFSPHGMENQGLQTVIIDRSVSILVAKPDMLTPVIPTHGRYSKRANVQGHPWLHSRFEASILSCFYLKNKTLLC